MSEPFEFGYGEPVKFQDWASRQIEKLAAGFGECEQRLARVEEGHNVLNSAHNEDFRRISDLERRLAEHRDWHALKDHGECDWTGVLRDCATERDAALSELREIKADYHNIIRKCNNAEWERDEARGRAKAQEKIIKDYEMQACRFRDRIRELEKGLRDIKVYAEAHHGQQKIYELWHALSVDIPQMADVTLQDPGTN